MMPLVSSWRGTLRQLNKKARRAKCAAKRRERRRARDNGERRRGRGYDWARRELLLELVRGAAQRQVNAGELARKFGCNPKTLREHLEYWRGRGLVRRTAAGGGRGRGSTYELDQVGLARLLRECDRENVGAFSPTPPLSPKGEHQVLPDGSHRKVTSKVSAPTLAELRSDWERFTRLQTESKPEQAFRAAMRLVRLVCWRAGFELAESKRVTAAVGLAWARIGKASKRRYLLGEFLRWVKEPAELRGLVGNWLKLRDFALAGFERPRAEELEARRNPSQCVDAARRPPATFFDEHFDPLGLCAAERGESAPGADMGHPAGRLTNRVSTAWTQLEIADWNARYAAQLEERRRRRLEQ